MGKDESISSDICSVRFFFLILKYVSREDSEYMDVSDMIFKIPLTVFNRVVIWQVVRR